MKAKLTRAMMKMKTGPTMKMKIIWISLKRTLKIYIEQVFIMGEYVGYNFSLLSDCVVVCHPCVQGHMVVES